MTIHFDDMRNAIRAGNAQAPSCVGYRKGKGWFVYDAPKGCPSDAEPELMCVAPGRWPVPLSSDAQVALNSIFRTFLGS